MSWKKINHFPVFTFFTWRLLLFIPLYLGERFITYRSGYEYTRITRLVLDHSILKNYLLYPWANFDGGHYLGIAANGYTNNYGFLPLFPISIYLTSAFFGEVKPFGEVEFFSAFFISQIVFLTALIFFYKLIRLDYSEYISKQTLIFLLLFPTSFFFVSIYSEGLFFLLIILSFYFARRKQWFFASLFGSLATITRIVGISIFPAIIYEFLIQENYFQKKKLSKASFKKAISLLLIPLGILSYSFYNWYVTGDILRFLHVHGTLGNGRSTSSMVFIPRTIFRYEKILFSLSPSQFEWWIALLEISTFIFVSIMLFLAWKKKIRPTYIIYAVSAFLIPAFSGTFTALPRYALILFPMYMVISLTKSKIAKITYMITATILLILLLMHFSRGYFVA